jgi:hypothetical protein
LKAERATRMWHPANSRLLKAVQEDPILIPLQAVQFCHAIWLAIGLDGIPHGPSIEAAMCSEVIYPSELPWACRSVPFHFRLPSWRPVESLHLRAHHPISVGPSKNSSVQRRDLPSQWILWSSACALVKESSFFTFGHLIQPSFEVFPRACARPKTTAVGNEQVGLPDELIRTQDTVVFRSSPRCPWHSSLCPGPKNNVHHVMLHTLAVRMKSLQAAERPAYLASPLQLLTVYWAHSFVTLL